MSGVQNKRKCGQQLDGTGRNESRGRTGSNEQPTGRERTDDAKDRRGRDLDAELLATMLGIAKRREIGMEARPIDRVGQG